MTSFSVTPPPPPPDTRRPTVKALNAVKTHPGKATTIRFRVHDPSPSCGRATVTIAVKRPGGATAWTKILPGVRTNKTLSYRFKCPLRSGLYRYYLSCSDAAGNHGRGESSRGFRVY